MTRAAITASLSSSAPMFKRRSNAEILSKKKMENMMKLMPNKVRKEKRISLPLNDDVQSNVENFGEQVESILGSVVKSLGKYLTEHVPFASSSICGFLVISKCAGRPTRRTEVVASVFSNSLLSSVLT